LKLYKQNSIRNSIAIMLMTIAFESGAAEYVKGAEHFATVSRSGDHPNAGCATVVEDGLTVGQPVAVVVLSEPRRLIKGFITSKSASPCADFSNTGLASLSYALGFPDAKLEPGELGILIGNAVSSLHINERTGVVAMNGIRYKFDECTSHEAVHLTVRSSTGSRSQLVWHDYVYLGYDVEPTCTQKELAAMEALARLINRSAPARAR
jgi:hypothetical protein